MRMPEEVNRVLTDPASDMERFDGSKKEEIVKMATVFNPKRKQKNVFGDGKASKRIVEIIRWDKHEKCISKNGKKQ